ncbi:MAG: hypothetical protein DHS20C15_30460 [Planctomycetota bacterium]|nr:MAG: hypothetical protein DHS20C15_30460 [Planctomycetota bacterium]
MLARACRHAPGVTVSEQPSARATCYACRKPARLCVCARVPELRHRTQVLVLQHHRERFHPVGTARLARLGLTAATVREVAGPIARPPLLDDVALLYPGPQARSLNELDAASPRPQQLIVLDGTWRQARQLYRENAWLRALPQVAFTPRAPSRYRIRKPPAPHCVSTIEAILEALHLLEPGTVNAAALLQAFDEMIDAQAEFMSRDGKHSRYQQRKPRPSRAVPAELLARPDDVLLVYGETAPLDPTLPGRTRQLLRWSAWRPATRETFDALVQPVGNAPPEAQLAHLGVPAERWREATSPAQLAADWRAFRRPTDLVASWHPAVLTMLAWFDSSSPSTHALKSLWSNLTHASPGKLETFVQTRGLERPDLPLDGRSGVRLAAAEAALRELLRKAPAMARAPGASGMR